MSKQANKVAIVTGASRGIGAAVAERLAHDGFAVVVNYAGSEAPAEAVIRKIEAAGGRAMSARADVADSAAVIRLFDAAETGFGGVDVLVNNAGIMKLATLAESDDALFDSQVAVNLKGTLPLHYRQRRRSRTHRDRSVPERKVAGTHRPHVQDEPAGAARHTRRHRRRRCLPGRPRWFLDQRPGASRQRRDDLTATSGRCRLFHTLIEGLQP